MKKKADIIITGDTSIDRFLYIEGLTNQPPNLREAWIDARKFWNITLDGGAGNLISYMGANDIKAVDPCIIKGELPESIYLLTRKIHDKLGRWYIDKAIVAGEREYDSSSLESCSLESFPSRIPCVILDFNQGWVNRNLESLPTILNTRSYIIRSHDPRHHAWHDFRKNDPPPGIWFSPIQDMAEGSLWFPGNWETLNERIIDYLKDDETLYANNKWRHYVIIQISYDGALIVGPGFPENGEMFIFMGDQPESFSRKCHGTVVAGGIVFVHSLAEALLGSGKLTQEKLRGYVKYGLARLRKLLNEGYVGPQKKEENWQAPSVTNLPVAALNMVETSKIIHYTGPPKANLETAYNIVCESDDVLQKNISLQLGNLLTTSPEYAHTLLRLTSRLENHLGSDDSILSFSIFGGPGSGKSFVAKQIAKAIDPEKKKFYHDTYNISQFTDMSRLIDAFKLIQTKGIQGHIPFIIWDEFDTALNGNKGGWLSSFLMPMQDAEFFDGAAKQSLGKCVFVFIGGTFKDDSDFGGWASSEEGRKQKGTDFHSRLDSSLTVPSVDLKDFALKNLKNVQDEAKLVRAIMIRTFLRKSKNIRWISQDVLIFLLHAPLEHGVRSLQKIIIASELSKTICFEMYHLPPLEVLQLHVDLPKLTPMKDISSYVKKLQTMYSGKKPLKLNWRH